MIYRKGVKRGMDVLVSVAGLIVLSPLLLLVSLLLAVHLGGTPFFVQERAGRAGLVFRMIKFRTMKSLFNSNGNPLPDEERLTGSGKWLRKLSLDELPQLINVLKGDMSLVGPRPLLMEYLPLYNEKQQRRHLARPGITGWAQVNGRNALNWEEKFDLDIWYIDHWSLILDLKILGLTLIKVLKREGISQEGRATMDKFRGSK